MKRLLVLLSDLPHTLPPDTVASVGGGLLLGPVIVFINRYVFDDWAFFVTLMILVITDTGLGLYKAWRLKKVASNKFAKVFTKVLVYFALLVATHAAAHLKVNGKPDVLLTWLDGVVYAGIVVRELLSIVEKAGALGVIMPAFLMKRLRDFDDAGKHNPE